MLFLKIGSPYLKEWIEYHKIVGIQHFYMYNNNSNDDYLAILQPYIEAGDVTFLNWPYEQGQMSAYRDCVKIFEMRVNGSVLLILTSLLYRLTMIIYMIFEEI